MTFIVGDKIKIDGYYKINLEGQIGHVISCDYENEEYLFKNEIKEVWINARYLTRI